MNIFVLNKNTVKCAQEHCDKHVVKMILESCQLLSTAHRILDGEQYIKLSKDNRKLKAWKLLDEREELLCAASHINHPCGVWCRENSANYLWLHSLAVQLCKEYTHRYKKHHLYERNGLLTELANVPANLKIVEFQNPKTWVQAMPEEHKRESVEEAYQTYYIKEKERMLVWTKRNPPAWINNALVV